MTDEEIWLRAWAKEAIRQIEAESGHPLGVTTVAVRALRLAREGWMPPDPLETAMKAVKDYFTRPKLGGVPPCTEDSWRYAIELGIEIGRGQGR